MGALKARRKFYLIHIENGLQDNANMLGKGL